MIALCRAINIPGAFREGIDYGAAVHARAAAFHAYVETFPRRPLVPVRPDRASPRRWDWWRIGTGREAADVSLGDDLRRGEVAASA
jgi:hypothetical protein